MKVMAIDLGDARTGIAVSDAMGWLTGFTTVIHSWNKDKTAQEIAALVKTHRPERIVMGFPRNKLSQVRFEIPMQDGKEDYLAPWRFSSDDGRFEMAFTPILNRAAYTSVGVIKSDQNQVFGRFTGTAALDDGTVLQVNDFFGFAEKVENKW